MVNTRLICHLPIIVPPDCGELRVGNYSRPWVEGEAFVFDDSVEHEAINRSDRERVVLLFDIWRPELTEEERHWVRTLLQAVDSFSD
jgi:aspartyl/asparaginyl beta-hydroxylase (cupin superfamily)